MSFAQYRIKAGILKAIEHMKYTEATPIQKQVIDAALTWENIVWQSQTGTGKTAAFLIPLLHRIDTNKKWLQALILAPTRELVNQIGDEIFNLTKFYRVNAVCVFGGASIHVQKQKLRKKPSIIVATPGRLMDLINQKEINLSPVQFFVLDEVDRMLDMGFVRDIKNIRAQMKEIKQTYTFSATISDAIKKIIEEHIPDYKFIKVGDEITVNKIAHSYIQVEHEDKLFNVQNIINHHKKEKIIIFTHTKRNTKTISTKLSERWYKAAMLNWDMSQGKRTSTLKAFKEWHTRILVTTDVAARGLNMDNIGLVINFDVPNDAESYVHRIGRTGRAWARGKAIILVSDLEIPLIKNIEKTNKIRIKQSEHLAVRDSKKTYNHIRLNRSTDKPGWKRATTRNTSATWPRSGPRNSYNDRKRKPSTARNPRKETKRKPFRR